MFLAARWGMGFVGSAIATYMTWKTAQIRSTQSATGILYIAMIFVSLRRAHVDDPGRPGGSIR